ncbi:MAG: TRAP transporter small permease subunit [Rhodocyclaceae bacterium]|nr:TRAP transporter small permease subunit [Rhodocyclaceae bacterium]MBX3670142.1 TRAP transporter small permease subunit [Rhodocyclaceae bacterium]
MKALLGLAALIDKLNEFVGKSVIWLVLVAVLISAINAIARKLFDVSSNAFLEMQWYLFSGVFLLGAAYTFQRNEHVRIDVVSGHFSHKTQAWIDVFGILFFLMPMAVIILILSWPVFTLAYQTKELSPNAGGLVLWPARLLVPVGFALLVLQGLAELIKRLGFIVGMAPDPFAKPEGKTAEEELAEAIRKEHANNGGGA